MKRFILSLLCLVGTVPVSAEAQWSTTHEQFYLPGSFNWQFRKNYPGADRLFNAFDYGHAILYERLWNNPNAAVSELEQKEFNFITSRLLVNPPDLPLEESAIEIAYVKIAPEAKMMFEWAHLLHRQIYDVLADERLSPAQKDAKVYELIRYYKTRNDLAFSSVPKSMDLMEGQPYSTAFRKRYPKFNGLIWAYHWLQIGLYEPLLAGKSKEERQTGVAATVTRFRQMIEQAPTWMPRVMPMTPAVAPLFTARYPEAAIIFDNLHSMHDVISDILANPSVSRDQKRSEILKAGQRYRDNTSFVVKADEWREMATMMGVENMGGPVRGFLPAFPKPTVERGATMQSAMAGMNNMAGMQHGTAPAAAPQPSMPGMDHSTMPVATGSTGTMNHSSMPGMTGGSSSDMAALHARMMADTVIRARVDSDPVLRDLLHKAMAASSTTAAHSHAAPTVKRTTAAKKPAVKTSAKTSTARKTTSSKTPAPKKTTATATAKPKPKPKVDPMAGMDHSKMNMTPKK
ncbi:MAG TPA: hypothetical protein VM053_02250 [Gemmatimonadaceae bacterium]|nr:hypothetical protein [Gemmatimonadaceae bacterium]